MMLFIRKPYFTEDAVQELARICFTHYPPPSYAGPCHTNSFECKHADALMGLSVLTLKTVLVDVFTSITTFLLQPSCKNCFMSSTISRLLRNHTGANECRKRAWRLWRTQRWRLSDRAVCRPPLISSLNLTSACGAHRPLHPNGWNIANCH